MKIQHEEVERIRRELEDITYPDRRDQNGKLHLTRRDCKLKFRLDHNGNAAAGVKEYELNSSEYGFYCWLNPDRIRSPKQLEDKVQFIKETIAR